LQTIFGTVEVQRRAYRATGKASLHPLDGGLNLAPDFFSLGVRCLVANESAKGSFDEVVMAVAERTGVKIGKRQVEELAVRGAQDFEAFYQAREERALQQVAASGPLLVLSVDSKGVVCRREDLRAATKKAAEQSPPKLHHRQRKGEKAHRKRMAHVASVYTSGRHQRTAADIMKELQPMETAAPARPKPEEKRVWASLKKSLPEVIGEAFAESLRRDPQHQKEWVALVDGSEKQPEAIKSEAAQRQIQICIVLDLIQVIEYLWKAAYVFEPEGSWEAESWVEKRLKAVLEGKASQVARGIKHSATLRELAAEEREAADTCADYLHKYRQYLRYDEYLAAGYPIATGVIEGACRYLVKDRMDITGARWRLSGAEAILRLRSLRASGDFAEYWKFHEQQELKRNHLEHYSNEELPRQPSQPDQNCKKVHLQLVR
jgi:hypothetical protein